jgi:hypothetical protein
MTLLNLTEVVAIKTDQSAFNNVQDAITGDVYPRTAGLATDKAGDLGSATYPWLAANVVSGYIPGGATIPWYDFNGLLDIPQGYMLCNGDVVSRSTYNIQHRTGVSDTTDYWALYIGSSPLEGLHLPSMALRYFKGTVSSTQAGSSALTYAGNIGTVVNLQHNHGSVVTTNAVATVNESNAGLLTYIEATSGTHTHNATITNDLSTAQDITPLSIDVKYLMRILE